QGTGNREQGTGNREQGTGNREQGTGNREQGIGATPRGQVTGDRLQVLGNFIFRYLCRFFPFTYLNPTKRTVLGDDTAKLSIIKDKD
ncbi:MAG: hypothetical protein RLZZ86_2931, partial [Cyanobacteriota bacterium]